MISLSDASHMANLPFPRMRPLSAGSEAHRSRPSDRPERSLLEGAAEFIGEMISGDAAYGDFRASTKGDEKEIESKFAADQEKTHFSDWLDNTTPGKPGDLGYLVGYRIAKSYYQHATNKRAAIHDIILMNDPHAFLGKSGWYPSIALK